MSEPETTIDAGTDGAPVSPGAPVFSSRSVTGPSAEEVKPSELQKNLMARLLTWQRESAKTFWIVGKPIERE